MIPTGPQMIVVIRPQKLRQSPAGQDLLAAFDKELGTAWERLEAAPAFPRTQLNA